MTLATSQFPAGLSLGWVALGIAGLWAGRHGWVDGRRMPGVARPRSFAGCGPGTCLLLGPCFIVMAIGGSAGGTVLTVAEVIGAAGLATWVGYTLAYLAGVLPLRLLPRPQRAAVSLRRLQKRQPWRSGDDGPGPPGPR